MADPKKVKVFDGTDWVDLKADDPNLPISNDDETVQLDDLTNPIWTNAFNIDIGDDKDNRKTVLRAVRPSDSAIPGGVGRQNINVFGNDNYTDYDIEPSQVGIAFQGPYIESNPNARDFLASLTVEQSRSDGYRHSDFVFYVNRSGSATQQMTEVVRLTKDGNGIFTGQVQTDTITTKNAAVNDAKIIFGAGNCNIETNSEDGVISLRNNSSGNTNIFNISGNAWASQWGTFGGGYSWWGQNIEVEPDGVSFTTRYAGNSNIGSFLMSPLRDQQWGISQGSMRVYPPTPAGETVTVPQSEMPQVMAWDCLDGRISVGPTSALSNTRLYTSGPDFIVNAAISVNATGLYSQYELRHPDVSNIGNYYWQTKDNNIYLGVDPVGEDNADDYEWQLVDRNEQDENGNFVYQSGSGTHNYYARSYITCDHGLTAWHDGLYVESPSWSNANSITGNPNPSNQAWRMGNYAGVRVMNCTITKTDALTCSFIGYQNASAAGNCYSFYAAGSAPARFNGGVQTDTITSKDGLVNGPFIELGDKKNISFRTNFSERVVIEEDGTLTSQMGTTQIGENRTAYKINETGNTGENSFSIDWTFANGGFANTDAQGRIGVRREGLEPVGGSANFSMEFFVASRPSGTSESDVLTKALEIRYDGQLIAKDGYEPEEDNSLVNKQYVDDGISQAIEGSQGDATLGAGTPTSETTPDDAPGSMLFDENYLWLKTNTVWKKIPLAGFNAPAATATVQVSQAQYNALDPKDPNTLYIIVG